MVRERSTKSRVSGLVGDKVWGLKREKYPEPYEADPETLLIHFSRTGEVDDRKDQPDPGNNGPYYSIMNS